MSIYSLLFFLILLLTVIYLNKSTYIETFATCISREYIKTDKDEYEPIQEVLCNGLTNKDCKKQEQDCVLLPVDIDDFEETNDEEMQRELHKMVSHCMMKDPTVTLDSKCMKRELFKKQKVKKKLGRLSRRAGAFYNKLLYKSILKKCSLDSKDKYVIDKDCQIF